MVENKPEASRGRGAAGRAPRVGSVAGTHGARKAPRLGNFNDAASMLHAWTMMPGTLQRHCRGEPRRTEFVNFIKNCPEIWIPIS